MQGSVLRLARQPLVGHATGTQNFARELAAARKRAVPAQCMQALVPRSRRPKNRQVAPAAQATESAEVPQFGVRRARPSLVPPPSGARCCAARGESRGRRDDPDVLDAQGLAGPEDGAVVVRRPRGARARRSTGSSAAPAPFLPASRAVARRRRARSAPVRLAIAAALS